jgi:hypothetical protein
MWEARADSCDHLLEHRREVRREPITVESIPNSCLPGRRQPARHIRVLVKPHDRFREGGRVVLWNQ